MRAAPWLAPLRLSLIAATAIGIILCASISAEPRKIGRALLTFYWMADESSPVYRGKQTAVLRDMRGKVIATTYKRFKRDLVMQGSGWLRDGRTLIYMQQVGGESRFRIVSAKYGLGSTGCPLIPFRTIAVDPRFVKHGSKVYIPQLKGAKLPDGTVHDGMFIAGDHGHFRGAHIDLFAGAGPRGARPFIRKGYGSRARVTVYVDGQASGCEP
jgi:3D (Asp-Asp-Asp) domain-containing protein